MWAKYASRKEILEIIRGGRLLNTHDLSHQESLPTNINLNDALLIWQNDPMLGDLLPSVIIIDQQVKKDFMAWVATYLTNIKPFTAYCRVIDRDSAERILSRKDRLHESKVEGMCLGLILGEVASYIASQEIRQLSYGAYGSTYSFAMAKALFLKILTKDSDPVSEPWASVRRLTKQQQLNPPLELIKMPWEIAVMLVEKGRMHTTTTNWHVQPGQLIDACFDLYNSGRIQDHNWRNLTQNYSVFDGLEKQMQGTREERVVIFEKSLQDLMKIQVQDKAIADFLCGYIVSLLAPGSYDYVNLLKPLQTMFPTALIWYGFCAGLVEGHSLHDFLNGVGRRISRDTFRLENILDRPRCDISWAELEVLFSGEQTGSDFRIGNQGYLSVEIAPCITTVVRWPQTAEYQTEMFSNVNSKELRSLIDELEHAVDRVNFIQSKLLSLVGAPDKRQFNKQKINKEKRKN